MKSFAFFLVLFLQSICYSQDSTNYQKLLQEFREVYFSSAKKDSTANFFTHLSNATNSTLHIDNPVFRSVKRDFKTYHLPDDSLLKKISDSIYFDFAKKFFFEQQQKELALWQRVLSWNNEKICACLVSKHFSQQNPKSFLQLRKECETTASSDAVLMARVNNEIKNASISDRIQIQKLVVPFLYQNCPEFSKTINNMLFNAMLQNNFEYTDYLKSELLDKVLRLYKENKMDSLSLIFLSYKNYEKDIRQSLGINLKSRMMERKIDEKNKNIEHITETIYTGGKAIKITGQIIYSLSWQDDELMLLTYKFLPPNKIPDIKKLQDELEKMPPQKELVPIKQ